MERGQVTVEMILIFGLFMMILIGVSVPSVLKSERYARDVQFASDARFASERLVTYAGSISNPHEKKTVEIYMPGYTSSANSTDNKPLMWMGMCTSISGSVLNTTLGMVRRTSDGTVTLQETHNFVRDLGSGNWSIYVNTTSGFQKGVLIESIGKRYNITIQWENITSNTVPSYTQANCDSILSLGGI
ncbi:hypothetical protein KKA03_01415 [archaeon]|nr:hypothetical protein [archaeon]